jgi:hypothetical protein
MKGDFRRGWTATPALNTAVIGSLAALGAGILTAGQPVALIPWMLLLNTTLDRVSDRGTILRLIDERDDACDRLYNALNNSTTAGSQQ